MRARASFNFKPDFAKLSPILTVANDLLDGFSQPTMLQVFFVVDNFHTSLIAVNVPIITMTASAIHGVPLGVSSGPFEKSNITRSSLPHLRRSELMASTCPILIAVIP